MQKSIRNVAYFIYITYPYGICRILKTLNCFSLYINLQLPWAFYVSYIFCSVYGLQTSKFSIYCYSGISSLLIMTFMKKSMYVLCFSTVSGWRELFNQKSSHALFGSLGAYRNLLMDKV